MSEPKIKYTVDEFHPVDGDFCLIDCDGYLLAKTYSRFDADKIITALKGSADMSIAIKAALTDDPDWRRLCVNALARAEGRAG